MNKQEQINKFLQTRGYDLRKLKGYDLNNPNIVSKALTKQEALDAIKFYHQLEIPILGGDVFFLNQENEIDWAYDNWYCERNIDEHDIEYLDKSIDKAISYIRNYHNESMKNCIFLFDIVYDVWNEKCV
jgi:hypothetical protein